MSLRPFDTLQRPLRDLRVSVTDRCNFRCPYCMPKEVFGRDWAFLPRRELLSFEEIERVVHAFVANGVEKLRITGGEPLLRRDLPRLIEALARIEGVRDLTMTTNGALLPPVAQALRDAGLRRLTVSLDALEEQTFRTMSDVAVPLAQVLAGIAAAEAAGFRSIKINMVVKRGVNEHCILPMAEHFRGSGHSLRFIEFMDVGHSNGWRMEEVVSADEVLSTLARRWPLQPLAPNYPGEVANRYRYSDGRGEIGVIASVTRPFCRGCTRARLTADGQFYTCLFGTHGHDLRSLIRAGASDQALTERIRTVWLNRADRYSEVRSAETRALPKVEMSRVGG
ncbi:MAG: GTP 3',8-cyclase MoaA [Gammaproteobacteria bacterium]